MKRTARMAILGFEFDEIARMLALMESSELEEIEWEEANRYLKVSGFRTAAPEPAAHTSPAVAPPAPTPRLAPPRGKTDRKAIAPKPPLENTEDQIPLVSPMVGMFYRSGKPGDPPFVEVGQHIRKDQAIGIIEAMKIFSEVPAEQGGLIIAIPVEDGQLVQAGTPLIILKKEG